MNNICIIGRLFDDPELRHTKDGIVCDLSVVVGDTYSKEDRVDLFEVMVVGELAESYVQKLSRGSFAGVSGYLRSDPYIDKLGVEHYIDRIITERVSVLPDMQLLQTKAEKSKSEATKDAPDQKQYGQKQGSFKTVRVAEDSPERERGERGPR
jgi:single stranded DNA-binding protein